MVVRHFRLYILTWYWRFMSKKFKTLRFEYFMLYYWKYHSLRKIIKISSSEPLCSIIVVLRKFILKFHISPLCGTWHCADVCWVIESKTMRVVSDLLSTLLSMIYWVQSTVVNLQYTKYNLPLRKFLEPITPNQLKS